MTNSLRGIFIDLIRKQFPPHVIHLIERKYLDQAFIDIKKHLKEKILIENKNENNMDIKISSYDYAQCYRDGYNKAIEEVRKIIEEIE